jgi:maltose alpha-D-glucosyltransferase/alpha-amylase
MNDLARAIHALLEPLYGPRANGVVDALERFANLEGLTPWMGSPAGWHRQMRMYCVYPDGVRYDAALSPLRNLALHIPHLKALAFTAIHVLPFWESPMRDMGYDISDYRAVRPDLGTPEDLLAFKAAADEAGMQVVVDAVLNHASDKGEWFRKAQAGEKRFRDLFIHTDRTPRFLRKFASGGAMVAEYEVDGAPLQLEIAFPELTGPVPHWRRGGDGFWYYHTYYPEELDLDWSNPDVFVEMGRIILHWAALGFHFRLDGIPFVGKPAYKLVGRGDPTNHRIVRAMRALARWAHPNAVFIAETFENLPSCLQYFGREGCPESDFVYNFHLCTGLWASLCKYDPFYAWEMLEREFPPPGEGQWLNFLRNHDELSLAHLLPGTAHDLRRTLGRYGKPFREGLDVAGRTVSLLGRNKARFCMAYFLLASLPGGLMMIYGEEAAFPNRPLNTLPKRLRRDTRNINRGVLLAKDLQSGQGREITAFLAGLFHCREGLRAYFEALPAREDVSEVFVARYRREGSELLACVNLSPRRRTLARDLAGFRPVTSVNRVSMTPEGVSLGPYAGIWLEGPSTA